jgi:long-chain fatty acid transport protein
VPSLCFHRPLTDQVHLGLFITAPFGFKTEYADGWMGRYNGIKTELKAVDMGAAGSYKVNDMLSLGASLFVERLDVKLRDAVDFGAMLAGARVPGFLPGSADGRTDINGHNTTLGYTLGALLRPSEGLSVGVAYRSRSSTSPTTLA